MASPDDDLIYLSPSFDPASLTIPKLRNVLMSHDIVYPASAKKAQLVEIFTQVLKPKARKILAARERVRRTSRGITDMPSSQEGTMNGDDAHDDDDDDSSMPPPPVPATPGQRRSRKTGQNKRPVVRKSRKSEVTPRIKIEEAEDPPVRPPMRGGVFSDENPFQSGSSPPVPGEHRRRSAGTSNEKRKSSSSRRRTEGVTASSSRHKDEYNVPSSKTFDVPVSRLKQPAMKDEPDNGLEAGEDFTPEEQLELVRARAANGEKDILPPRRKKRPQKSAVPKSAPWVILVALLGGYGTWWRQEKLTVGYCGIGRSSDALSSVQTPEWMSTLRPTCEPCPQHAICFQGGLIPLPPSCEPDGEKVRRVKTVADRAVAELRDRRAQSECGTLKDEEGKDIPAEIDEQDLKKEVGKKRRRGMGEAEFEELWKGAIGEIMGREEVASSSDGTHLYLSSTSLAQLPLTCAFRRSARLTLARHRISLSLVTLFAFGLLYIRSMIRTSRSDTARIPSLVATTLDRLATQAALYARGDAPESWISVGQLRDDVLRDEFSDKRRESIWKRVRVIVEKNANVRASVREGRGGDVSRVWEWIGSVGLLDDPWSSGRSSGGKRVSWGGLVDEGTPDSRGAPAGGEAKEMIEQRKWDEGRPIY
ncbi:hypothetical protein P7C71_g333, partial [Lecanoromycetidae sp. Uapishka_2]